jgi:hypothetical protein
MYAIGLVHNRAEWLAAWISGLGPQPSHVAMVQDKEAGN